MNIMPDDYIIINDIAINTLKLRVKGDDLINKMRFLGFLHSNDFMVKRVESENDQLDLVI
ncbi:hypothetical protein PEC301296_41060 [Pectobacterium carotovorum subsp. carotovorum]|nr:hypothetical protein GZ59_34190 [Pectobacterium atrosepticum]KMK82346.1 hypothetical protein KCQ_07505 [Pectobacterium atrosepticum ICMP 1526]GKV87795.1 hypothetical protein PEC301296_41060 [Pectobacterium carotovorum subsp. carotovorum]ATY91936.1 hypothetical protein CVS35_17045 [Pectobacterium atrosepticum]POW24079.1 hypothetical protein PB72LOC_04270 [Pectobacterium atrosepticum]